MNTKKISTLSMIFVMIACSQHQNIKTEQNHSEDSISPNNYPSQKTSNSDSSTLPDLRAGNDTFIMKLHLDGIKDRKIIPLKIISGKELFATIKTNTKRANNFSYVNKKNKTSEKILILMRGWFHTNLPEGHERSLPIF